jgi:putative glutamine amidotransferase
MPSPQAAHRVGVILSPRSSEQTRRNYLDAVDKAGLAAVEILSDDATASIRGLDGLVLAGGGDVNPALYGEPAAAEVYGVDHQRDRLELQAIEDAIHDRLPILAICRGHQVVNVALGGKLVQHIADDVHRAGDSAGHPSAWHPVSVESESRLASIFGRTEMVVNSRHHQGIGAGMLAPGLRATARAGDGYIEGFESDLGGGIIGVQWHPERVESDELDSFNDMSQELFAGFAALVGGKTGEAKAQKNAPVEVH